jgi:hypothetical protein
METHSEISVETTGGNRARHRYDNTLAVCGRHWFRHVLELDSHEQRPAASVVQRVAEPTGSLSWPDRAPRVAQTPRRGLCGTQGFHRQSPGEDGTAFVRAEPPKGDVALCAGTGLAESLR